MVDGLRPEILLIKLPVPVPSDVWGLNATVAPEEVLQQTPRTATAEPPSVDIFPPDTAVELVIEEIAADVRVGIVASGVVVNVNSCPYPVPVAFVAYERT